MKLVKEHINEKFTLDSDPIYDMGIGLYTKRDFNNINKLYNFLIDVIPLILNTKEIPQDILKSNRYFMKPKYMNRIEKYIIKYITYNGRDQSNTFQINQLFFYWPEELNERLQKRGFKE